MVIFPVWGLKRGINADCSHDVLVPEYPVEPYSSCSLGIEFPRQGASVAVAVTTTSLVLSGSPTSPHTVARRPPVKGPTVPGRRRAAVVTGFVYYCTGTTTTTGDLEKATVRAREGTIECRPGTITEGTNFQTSCYTVHASRQTRGRPKNVV